ncbi:hypothetical protein Sme01_54100 [Sphaerisporangium melleum]|uniref:Uncharacterized protein n=1 Tax=Sphaerisporangium melleum TaxID=321316 RepID=A0A917R6E8_9ACTN|nr:DUF6229 family protein [Sphaerisporangium melleum]GGK91757.1 hypothetical protein GCM10007964_37960 [Sphaerisporangium melleum]GII72934.1 hypothetical protein Sme01_54100 [Sphaerisporangium melleum]
MPLTLDRSEEIVAAWRSGADVEGWDNPAGPLFIGDYAESEITLTALDTRMASSCTCSRFCC